MTTPQWLIIHGADEAYPAIFFHFFMCFENGQKNKQ
jgi:hypothetical protein